MNPLDRIVRTFFWRPAGCVPSLEALNASHSGLDNRDVTAAVGAKVDNRHPLSVVVLPGGKIIGDLRLAATADDVVIGGLQSLFGCNDPESHYLLHRRRFRMSKYRRGTALLLGAGNSDNYYHWMLDSLPRWRMSQVAEWHDYNYVLLHSKPRRFQEETLDWLGVPAEKRLRLSKNFVHQFERLVVPAMPFPLEEVPAWTCSWLRSLVPQGRSGPEKIFLSRRGIGARQLVNEGELQSALEARGFVTVKPEEMSVLEQARVMSAVRCVVAPHGAALVNLVFAPPGALLFELFHPQHKNRCYVNLAAACGHRYFCLEGRVINSAEDRELTYAVNVPRILSVLLENNRA